MQLNVHINTHARETSDDFKYKDSLKNKGTFHPRL